MVAERQCQRESAQIPASAVNFIAREMTIVHGAPLQLIIILDGSIRFATRQRRDRLDTTSTFSPLLWMFRHECFCHTPPWSHRSDLPRFCIPMGNVSNRERCPEH